MKCIGIGPLRNKIIGSWRWFGIDLFNELKKYYVMEYVKFGQKFEGDLLIIVKNKKFLLEQLNKTKIIYLPIDVFKSKQELIEFKEYTNKVSQIIIHCHRLSKFFPEAIYINHHIKYVVNNEYKENGPIIWVGLKQYLCYLSKYNNNKLKIDIINEDNWSEQYQLQKMLEAKAAIDIKGENFHQFHKPPTKAMDFLASGIPLAMNIDSSSSEYFRNFCNFSITTPEMLDYWWSYDYWKKCQQLSKLLRKDFSLEKIGLQFKAIIDSLI